MEIVHYQFSQYLAQTINQYPELMFWSTNNRFLYIDDELFRLYKTLSLDQKLIFVLDKLNYILARRVLSFFVYDNAIIELQRTNSIKRMR